MERGVTTECANETNGKAIREKGWEYKYSRWTRVRNERGNGFTYEINQCALNFDWLVHWH
jgi:hypothetical protein